MKLSNRINSVSASQSVTLAQKVIELRQSGQKVIGFNVGEPDFDTPSEVLEATKAALYRGETRYGAINGIEKLRAKLAFKIEVDQSLKVEPSQISIAQGSKQVLYNIFQLLCQPGDEVIIPCPYWVSFPEMVKLSGATPVFAYSEESFFNLETIKNLITKKTKAIIINSPNNPTGMMIPNQDIKELVELARKHQFYIISDEAYEGLLFDGRKFLSPAALYDKDFDVSISVQSFSKTFCMTGFRLGYIIANKSIVQAFNKLQSHLSGNVTPFIQWGAIAALDSEEKIKANMREIFQKRRDLAHNVLTTFVDCPLPDGAFYLFPKVTSLYNTSIKNDIKLAEYILDQAHVAVLPGSFFGYPDHLRICFSASEEDIIQGLEQIRSIL